MPEKNVGYCTQDDAAPWNFGCYPRFNSLKSSIQMSKDFSNLPILLKQVEIVSIRPFLRCSSWNPKKTSTTLKKVEMTSHGEVLLVLNTFSPTMMETKKRQFWRLNSSSRGNIIFHFHERLEKEHFMPQNSSSGIISGEKNPLLHIFRLPRWLIW